MLNKILFELGLPTLYATPRSVKLLLIQRFIRLFTYGGTTLILAPFLSKLGNSDAWVGLFMTLTLVGDVVISFLLTLFADRLGRKLTLAIGALMMMASGAVFASTGQFWVLLGAAIVGVITPSGNEVGPFRAIEDSTIAQLTSSETRSDVFAWFMVVGGFGISLGVLVSGWFVSGLKARGWDAVNAYRIIFIAYAAFALVKLLLVCGLGDDVEILNESCAGEAQHENADERRHGSPHETRPDRETATDTESDPLIRAPLSRPGRENMRRFLPSISKESRTIIAKLCVLFAVDSFASGLTPMSWVTYFFKQKFSLEDGVLGSLFFAATITTSFTALLASSIAKRIGNLNAMVLTHLPSSIALALIPAPSFAPFAIALLLFRSCTCVMDGAPRSAFLADILLHNERTAAMGLITVVKTASQSFSPWITGVLASRSMFWAAFVLAGVLMTVYDLLLMVVFAQFRRKKGGSRERLGQE